MKGMSSLIFNSKHCKAGDFPTYLQETDLKGFQPKILLNLKQNLNIR